MKTLIVRISNLHRSSDRDIQLPVDNAFVARSLKERRAIIDAMLVKAYPDQHVRSGNYSLHNYTPLALS